MCPLVRSLTSAKGRTHIVCQVTFFTIALIESEINWNARLRPETRNTLEIKSKLSLNCSARTKEVQTMKLYSERSNSFLNKIIH